MKKSVILSAILFGSLVYSTAEAQISIHLGFNVPVRRVVYAPAPQPVETVYNDDFDDSDDYYYLPEVEAYYSLSRHCYFYNDGARWISAAYLPGAYRNYDWRAARHFEIRGRRPYMNHDIYRGRWGGNDNRGDWNRGNYAGRGYDNRNYGGGGFNRGGYGGYQPRNNGYNQPQPGRNDDRGGRGGWDHQSQGDDSRGRGNWGGGQMQPQQPNRGDDNRGRGNWGGGQMQPQQPNQNPGGGRGNWSGGQPQQPGQPAQPSNNGGGRDRGNGRGGQDRGSFGGGQFAQNPGRMGMARPRF